MATRLGFVLCTALLGSAIGVSRTGAQSPDAPAPAGRISIQELEFRQGLTPDGWAKNADGMPKCTLGAPGTDLVEQQWKTDSLAGVVSLPKEFHEAPVAPGADGARWVGADSSSIEIHGTHALYRGGIGMGGMDIGRPLGAPTTCALTLEGRNAPSHLLRLTRPVHGDTLYVDTPNTVIRNGIGLQFIILTHSAAREAQLLAVVQSLKLSPPKSP
jgi:hypothetical protein